MTIDLEKKMYENILNKSENATRLLLVKMAEKSFLFQFLFYKIKCVTSSYHLRCARVSSK